MNRKKSIIIICALAITLAIIIPLPLLYPEIFFPKGGRVTTITDYTGKVIQVDHPTTTSGGLFFSNSRTDTYVTFDNNNTYWAPGYQIIVVGYTYHVHSVTTILYGAAASANQTSPFDHNATLTTTVNTFNGVN